MRVGGCVQNIYLGWIFCSQDKAPIQAFLSVSCLARHPLFEVLMPIEIIKTLIFRDNDAGKMRMGWGTGTFWQPFETKPLFEVQLFKLIVHCHSSEFQFLFWSGANWKQISFLFFFLRGEKQYPSGHLESLRQLLWYLELEPLAVGWPSDSISSSCVLLSVSLFLTFYSS